VRDVVKNLFMPWRHTYRLFVEVARRFRKIDGVTFRVDPEVHRCSNNSFDKWILSALQSLIKFVRREMAEYRLYTVVPALVSFTDQLSKWYARINKNRLKGVEGHTDTQNALATLFHVLFSLCRLMAPFTPFLVESMYQNLKRALPANHPDRQDSVHYLMIPEVQPDAIDENIERQVSRFQKVTDLGRAAREKAKISHKIPINQITVVHRDEAFLADVQTLLGYLKSELNCKSIVFTSDARSFGSLVAEPNRKLLGPAFRDRASAIADAISKLSHEQLVEFEEKASIDVLGQRVSLDMAVVRWQSSVDEKAFTVQMDAGVTVVLPNAVDERNKQEGTARNVMSAIQKARKKAGLKLEDRAVVYYSFPSDLVSLREVLVNFGDFMSKGIKASILPAAQMPPHEKPFYSEEVSIGGDRLTITLVKVDK